MLLAAMTAWHNTHTVALSIWLRRFLCSDQVDGYASGSVATGRISPEDSGKECPAIVHLVGLISLPIITFHSVLHFLLQKVVAYYPRVHTDANKWVPYYKC